MGTLNQVTTAFTLFLASIAGISLVVGGIGIMNMMLTAVTERTREIGLRKSIGAKSRDITVQFLAEAVVLTFIGGMIGIVRGSGVAFVVFHLRRHCHACLAFLGCLGILRVCRHRDRFRVLSGASGSALESDRCAPPRIIHEKQRVYGEDYCSIVNRASGGRIGFYGGCSMQKYSQRIRGWESRANDLIFLPRRAQFMARRGSGQGGKGAQSGPGT